MKGKTLLIALVGAVAAGVCCLVVGLILFFALRGNAIVLICSFLAICMGAAMTAVAGIALVTALLLFKKNKSKNKIEDGDKNDG